MRLVLIMKKGKVAAKLVIIMIAQIVKVEGAREEHHVVKQEMRQMNMNPRVNINKDGGSDGDGDYP